jgi:hypothetical protein
MADIEWIAHVKVVRVVESGKVLKIDLVANTMTWYDDLTAYEGEVPIDDGEIGVADHQKTKDLTDESGE